MLRIFYRYFACSFLTLATLIPGNNALAADDPDLGELSDEQLDEFVEFVVGNSIFILFHEAGHMLVSEFDLPVLGREEDAVDTLSSILMLEADDETFDNALMDAADGWFLSGEATAAAEEEETFWGAHNIDEQRAWSIVCLMAGHNADDFETFIKSLDFPDDRKEECKDEYQRNRNSWFSVLAKHEASEGQKTDFVIKYEAVEDENLKLYADMVREADLLGIVREVFSGVYGIDNGIKLTAKSCGEANAYWSSDDREITFCYEFAEFYGKLVANYFIENGEEEADE